MTDKNMTTEFEASPKTITIGDLRRAIDGMPDDADVMAMIGASGERLAFSGFDRDGIKTLTIEFG